MKKLLSLLIVHYKEDEKTIKRCLDSIAIQQHIDWNEIEVIIGNDGDEVVLSDELFKGYPFEVNYKVFEKGGISRCRNRLLGMANGDYIQWIDGDDCFFNVIALWMTMREIKANGFDALRGEFVCEIRRPDNGEIDYIPYLNMGWQFVHGAVYNKKFLIDNDINFREDAPVHEDAPIFGLTRAYTQNIKLNPTPTYVWCHNENSVSRKDKYYLQHTTKYLLMNQSWVLEKLYKKGKLQEIREHAYSIFVDMYYSLCCDQWLEECTKEDRMETEGMFKHFYNTYKKYADELDADKKKQIELGQKQSHTMQGLSFESYTWGQWIKHIEEEVKPIEFEIKSQN